MPAPTRLLRSPSLKIFSLSLVMLSLELSLIRFEPAEVKALSYFINLLLFSSFFGIGVGCILSRGRPLHYLMPLGSFLIFLFLVATRGIMIYDTGGVNHFWLMGMEQAGAAPVFQVPIAAAAIMAFILASLPFIALGQMLANAMDRLPRLQAYSWDIAGAICGTLIFSLGSYFGLPPWIWISVCLALFAFLAYESWIKRIPSLLCALSFLYFFHTALHWQWSPYYFVQFEPSYNSMMVFVNSGFHQQALNFESTDPGFIPVARETRTRFELPYRTYKVHHAGKSPESVLILGAGTGNDAYIAIKNGAKHVVAVEIDPAILAIGRDYNPLRPYQNPAVTIVNDDGRHFLRSTKETFDLVIFGTLDSQTLLSGHANLRLENYIYTKESFEDARRVLRDGGQVAAYYSVHKLWLVGRLYATMNSAFPGTIRYTEYADNLLFNLVMMGARDLPDFQADPGPLRDFSQTDPLTDDWPFIYLEHREISSVYQIVFFFVSLLALAVFLSLRKLHGSLNLRAVFFFLGMGFTLLEAAAVVRLALLFGAVWIVSALVFVSALAMIFLANLCVWKKAAPSIGIAWGGLFSLLLLNFLVPMNWLLAFGFFTKLLVCFSLVGMPVFFAGICFSRLFSREKETGIALGINLVGAMVGGLLEYLSMVLGMRAIWLVVVLVYLLALWASRRELKA